MKQSKTESLEILETVLSMMKKIIKNQWEKVILGVTNIFNIARNKILSIEGYLNKIRPYLKKYPKWSQKIKFFGNSITDSN